MIACLCGVCRDGQRWRSCSLFAVYHILSHVFRFGRARNASLLSMRFQALSVFLFFFVGGAVSSSKSERPCCRFGGEAGETVLVYA